MAYLKIQVCGMANCLQKAGVSRNGTWHLFDIVGHNSCSRILPNYRPDGYESILLVMTTLPRKYEHL